MEATLKSNERKNSMRLYTQTKIGKERSKKSLTNPNVKTRSNWVWGMASHLQVIERVSGKFAGCIDQVNLFLNEDARIKRVYNRKNDDGITITYNDNSTAIYMNDSQAEELVEKLQKALAEKRS